MQREGFIKEALSLESVIGSGAAELAVASESAQQVFAVHRERSPSLKNILSWRMHSELNRLNSSSIEERLVSQYPASIQEDVQRQIQANLKNAIDRLQAGLNEDE